MPKQQLSLWTALLINMNIILGAGVFINTVELAKRTGALSPFSYVVIGILLFPLIVSMAALVRIYPDGGFYSFATPLLGSFAGFFSTWSYFIGKLASATLMVHVSAQLIRECFPALLGIPILALDTIFISTFMLLNMCNMKVGSNIQAGFLISKLIPLVFVIAVGFILCNPLALSIDADIFSGFASTIPLVLYATIGFEATCSISRHIHNPRRNAPIALFTSYLIVIFLLFLYQYSAFWALGPLLSSLPSYLQAFPLLIGKIVSNTSHLSIVLTNLMYLTIATSALGGAYAIMYSNMWNLYTLASHGHTFASNTIVQTNKAGIPFVCVLAQGIIMALYLMVTHGSQISLQQTGALAVTISYAISVVSLLLVLISRKKSWYYCIIPILALGSTSLLIHACINNFFTSGLEPLTLFLGMLLTGCIMFWVCNTHALHASLFLLFVLPIVPVPLDPADPLASGTNNRSLQLSRLSTVSHLQEQEDPPDEHSITIPVQQSNYSSCDHMTMKRVGWVTSALTGCVFTVGTLLITGVIGSNDDGSIHAPSAIGCLGLIIPLTAASTLSCMGCCTLPRSNRRF